MDIDVFLVARQCSARSILIIWSQKQQGLMENNGKNPSGNLYKILKNHTLSGITKFLLPLLSLTDLFPPAAASVML